MATRTRYSLEYLQQQYDLGNRLPLEKLIRAFRGIQALPPTDENSFFFIAGFHGLPFRGPGKEDPKWWGGYCWHRTVLFPTWHRAYVLRLEDALRSIPGCEDVTMPYWDELLQLGTKSPIPTILTSPNFELDGQTIANPLYSYKLQEQLKYLIKGKNERYSKPEGYETVRYPLSGLVGNKEDTEATRVHNETFGDAAKNAEILNENVANWLAGKAKIDEDGHTKIADIESASKRYFRSLDAPNYTVFSNVASQNEWIQEWKKEHPDDPDNYPIVSLESGHDAIHLAVGGFYQEGEYNANPIRGANGDMGANEMAGFDPIFFFHHCFIDYVFAIYQKRKGLTKRGSLTIEPGYPGTVLKVGQPPDFEPNTDITLDMPLIPFKKPDGSYYTSHEVTDFETDLHYVYQPGSLEPFLDTIRPAIELSNAPTVVARKKVYNVKRTQVEGSFVIRLYAQRHDGRVFEVGGEPVLSRWDVGSCANCQNVLDVTAYIPVYESMMDILQGPEKKAVKKWWGDVQTWNTLPERVPPTEQDTPHGFPGGLIVEDF